MYISEDKEMATPDSIKEKSIIFPVGSWLVTLLTQGKTDLNVIAQNDVEDEMYIVVKALERGGSNAVLFFR